MGISFGAGQRIFFVGLLTAVSLAFIWMLRDFLFPVFWAIVFALLLHPTYVWLTKRVRYESLAAIIVIFCALLLVLIPISFIGTQVAQEAAVFYRSVSQNGALSDFSLPAPALDVLSYAGIDAQEVRSNIASLIEVAGRWIATEALAVSTATFSVIVKTLLMLYLLFFFLRDGERIGAYVMKRLPLGDRKERALFDRFAATTRATMKGTVVVALAQGAAGGILFGLAGIENALLWGVVMAFFSIIPAIGAGGILIPAGIYLLLTGSLVPAIIVLAGGALVVGSLDNVLRPLLVGRETKMPDALILLSIAGGLATFGITGVIVGPVIAALVLAAWDIFAKEYEAQLTAQG